MLGTINVVLEGVFAEKGFLASVAALLKRRLGGGLGRVDFSGKNLLVECFLGHGWEASDLALHVVQAAA